MEEFKLMARLLAAIRASEEKEIFDLNLVSEQVLKTTVRKRDKMTMKLQKAINEIKAVGISTASQVIANVIFQM